MSTKPLFFTSIALIFLAGWAFGFSLGDMRGTAKLVPASERERVFYDNWQTARLSATNPADNFRVSVATAARDYIFTVAEAARAIARGGDAVAVTAATDARTASLVAPFESIISKPAQAQHLELWKAMTSAIYAYAAALRTADPAAITTAKEGVNVAVGQLAKFYPTVGIETPATTLQAGFSRAMIKLEQLIEGADAGPLSTTLENEQRAAQELSGIMDVVTTRMVSAYQIKF